MVIQKLAKKGILASNEELSSKKKAQRRTENIEKASNRPVTVQDYAEKARGLKLIMMTPSSSFQLQKKRDKKILISFCHTDFGII
jgi:hypothetical protein